MAKKEVIVRASGLAAIVVISIVGTFASGATAHAATVRHVSPTGSDVGDCSVAPCRTIGYAITQSASGDTVQIAAGTYAEDLVVDRSLTLTGAGASKSVIDGSGAGRVMWIGSSKASLTVSLSGLTIRKGHASTGGGLSSVPGSSLTNRVVLRRVVLLHNKAVGGGSAAPDATGGAIDNAPRSTMTIWRSEIVGNSAVSYASGSGEGGGIFNAGKLSVTRSTVSGNWAAGDNSRSGEGGGIFNAGKLSVTGSTVSGNSANGGNSRAFGGGRGSGGGISGSVTLANSTVSGNTAAGGHSLHGPPGPGLGGGINTMGGAVKLVNSTIAGNSAVGGHLVGPAGGGIYLLGGSATLANTILARNHAGLGPDCRGAVISGGHNLLGSDSSCSGFTGSGDLINVDPVLGPLQNNGGPTQTMALTVGSPAIDAGDDTVCAAPPVNGVDQRGQPRPGGQRCDIGAFEVQPG